MVDVDRNITTDFSEVEFELENESVDDKSEVNGDYIPVRKPMRSGSAKRSFQYENSSYDDYYPFGEDTTVSENSFIVLSGNGNGLTTIKSSLTESPAVRIVTNARLTTKNPKRPVYNKTANFTRLDHQTANRTRNSSTPLTPAVKKTHLNNCTLILLNIYLLAYKATCNYDDFADSLNHYDCLQNNFSVKSNCNNCKVSKSLLFYYDFTKHRFFPSTFNKSFMK